MIRLRPVQMEDLDALLVLAEKSVGGITSLPPDRDLLRQKIEHQAHFFVLEETENGRVIGCSAIRSNKDGAEPFHVYQMEDGVLRLVRIVEPLSEISTLFLDHNYRKGGLGHLLSYARFLFIALHPERFRSRVVARMRGVLDEDGVPTFWKEVCAPLAPLAFEEADLRRYIDPEFVDGLGLPEVIESTHVTIGEPHETTKPAVRMLEHEGFTYCNHVDIFDAGPILECLVADLWTVRHRREGQVRIVDQVKGEPQLVGNHALDFRACLTPIEHGEEILLPREAAEALEVTDGERISYRETAA
jgi:arginine N-succinyltransferase